MNKHDLGQKLAKKLGFPSSQMEDLLNLTFDLVADELSKGGKVSLSGFGSFQLSKRKGGKGFNPHTKEEVHWKEIKTVQFRPSEKLKNRVNRQKSEK